MEIVLPVFGSLTHLHPACGEQTAGVSVRRDQKVRSNALLVRVDDVRAAARAIVPRYCAFWAPTSRKPFSTTPFRDVKLGEVGEAVPHQTSGVTSRFGAFFGQVKNLARVCEFVRSQRTIAAYTEYRIQNAFCLHRHC